MKTYETSREELVSQARMQIALMRVTVADNLKKDKASLDFEKRRAVQHTKVLELRKSREEENVTIRLNVTVIIRPSIKSCTKLS